MKCPKKLAINLTDNMKAFLVLLPLLLALQLPIASAWLATGHLLTALIAQMRL